MTNVDALGHRGVFYRRSSAVSIRYGEEELTKSRDW